MLLVMANSASRRAAYRVERADARRCFAREDIVEGWRHLERAHILAQPDPIAHVGSHLAMLRRGVIDRDAREVVGQALRAMLAGPASLAGRIPTGNDGRSRTKLSEQTPIPSDLERFLPGQPRPAK